MSPIGDVTLREHFEQILAAHERAVSERFRQNELSVVSAIEAQRLLTSTALNAANAAVAKAEDAAEKRFEALNEFRGTLIDQQKTLLTRTEFDAVLAGLKGQLKGMEERLTRAEGSLIRGEGKGSGVALSWSVILGAAGLIAGILAIASRLAGP